MGSQTGEWGQRLARIDPAIACDPERLVVARRLHNLEVDGISVVPVVAEALGQGHLPADHAASALWWRVAGLLKNSQSYPPAAPRWEVVNPGGVRRPESERMPRNNPRHGGPHIGY